MARTTGKIISGEGNAQRNHAVLIPLLARHVPEILNCSPFGTINVQLDHGLDKSHADLWTPRIAWHPVRLNQAEPFGRIEFFGFIKILFEYPANGLLHHAWIMLPEGSKLTYREDQAEIIADVFVEGLQRGASCAIHIDHPPSIAAPPSFGAFYGKSLTARNSAIT
jgi:CTP-dependent riboflavin kinase